jgi:hypothetical protein
LPSADPATFTQEGGHNAKCGLSQEGRPASPDTTQTVESFIIKRLAVVISNDIPVAVTIALSAEIPKAITAATAELRALVESLAVKVAELESRVGATPLLVNAAVVQERNDSAAPSTGPLTAPTASTPTLAKRAARALQGLRDKFSDAKMNAKFKPASGGDGSPKKEIVTKFKNRGQLRLIFDDTDLDKNGTIELDEMVDGLSKMGMDVNPDLASRM